MGQFQSDLALNGSSKMAYIPDLALHPLVFNDTVIEYSNGVKILGVILDKHLTWEDNESSTVSLSLFY